MDAPRILAVFAHPDDEVFCCGGTLAKYVAAGGEATILCATRGEAGHIRRRMGPGEFFGEIALARRSARTAHVMAVDSVTCMVFSPGLATLYAGRGTASNLESVEVDQGPDSGTSSRDAATTVVDVSGFDRHVAHLGVVVEDAVEPLEVQDDRPCVARTPSSCRCSGARVGRRSPPPPGRRPAPRRPFPGGRWPPPAGSWRRWRVMRHPVPLAW